MGVNRFCVLANLDTVRFRHLYFLNISRTFVTLLIPSCGRCGGRENVDMLMYIRTMIGNE